MGNFLFKCKYPLQKGNFKFVFRASRMSAVAQNNQIKIILMATKYILGVAYSATLQCEYQEMGIMGAH